MTGNSSEVEGYNPYLPQSRQPMPGPVRPEPVPGAVRPEPLPRPQRTPDEIEAEINAARDRLAATVTALQDRVNPRNLARHAAAGVKRSLTTEDGRPKPEVVAAGAVLVLGIALVVWRRARR